MLGKVKVKMIMMVKIMMVITRYSILLNTTIKTSPLEHFWNFKIVGSNINNFFEN